MKTLNRTLLTLVVAIAVTLGWSLLSHTGWGSSVSLLGVGESYDNALQPIVKVAAAIVVMVAATQLVQNGYRFLSERSHTRSVRRAHQSVRASSG